MPAIAAHPSFSIRFSTETKPYTQSCTKIWSFLLERFFRDWWLVDHFKSRVWDFFRIGSNVAPISTSKSPKVILYPVLWKRFPTWKMLITQINEHLLFWTNIHVTPGLRLVQSTALSSGLKIFLVSLHNSLTTNRERCKIIARKSEEKMPIYGATEPPICMVHCNDFWPKSWNQNPGVNPLRASIVFRLKKSPISWYVWWRMGKILAGSGVGANKKVQQPTPNYWLQHPDST